MSTTKLKWTREEDSAIFRIKHGLPRNVGEQGVSDFIMDNGDVIVRELRVAAAEERAAIEMLVSAMKKSVAEGSTDHLDACEDGGAFWYDAIAKAERPLTAKTAAPLPT